MRAALACMLALWAGCSAPVRESCELAPPTHITSNAGLGFDGIALTAVRDAEGERPLYVWSDQTGLWAQAGTLAPVRLAERCRGGVAAAAHGSEPYVACSRPSIADDSVASASELAAISADEARALQGEVLVYRLTPALVAAPVAQVGHAGRDGRGVALGVEDARVWVVHHDGSIGEQSVVLSRIEGTRVHSHKLSHAGQVASEPALLLHAGHVYGTFSELDLARNEPASHVFVSRDGETAKRVVSPRAYSATPKLTADARGLVLSYRDRARAARLNSTRNELYVARLDDTLSLAGSPRAIGRANTEGEPTVYGCGALTTALLPREYGGERYVGINALDGELVSIGAGHQLYANGREFVQASGVCVDGAWLLFAADRAPPGKPGSEAVSMTFRCN